jgi:uncharacterized alkaline shock family protein YloU
MQENKTELNVSIQVLEKMAQIAACEIEGVTGLSKRAIDIKGSFKSKSVFKGVRAENINGAIEITVYICVAKGVKVREVASAVQTNVKDKIQTMTGTVVTKVNVFVADISIPDEEAQEA